MDAPPHFTSFPEFARNMIAHAQEMLQTTLGRRVTNDSTQECIVSGSIDPDGSPRRHVSDVGNAQPYAISHDAMSIIPTKRLYAKTSPARIAQSPEASQSTGPPVIASGEINPTGAPPPPSQN